MNDQATSGLSLFDLLARQWDLDAPVTSAGFSGDSGTAAFLTKAGQIALVPCDDAEAPDIRTNFDIETGRRTIRPRSAPPAPPRLPEARFDALSPVQGHGTFGFLLVAANGSVVQVTPAAQVVKHADGAGVNCTKISTATTAGTIAISGDTKISITTAEGPLSEFEIDPRMPVSALALSPDAELLAWHQGDTLSIRALNDPTTDIGSFDVSGPITQIKWGPRNDHIACVGTAKAMTLVDRTERHVETISGFPAPVRSVAFNPSSDTIFASGAFRLAGWRLADLPRANHNGTPLSTGKPALVLVEAVASHPTRPLCAAGFASGMITICVAGQPDELQLYPGGGVAVTALMWSGDGKHLAAGFADGRAALITFPKTMFK